jgi:hypothetical protein
MADDIFLAQILGHNLLGPSAVGQSYKGFLCRRGLKLEKTLLQLWQNSEKNDGWHPPYYQRRPINRFFQLLANRNGASKPSARIEA